MSGGPQVAMLADGRRLHLQHGPIDLVLGADGDPDEVAAAYRQAVDAFRPVLATLVDELPLLRRPIGAGPGDVRGPVARRMVAACRPFAPRFMTPMAAVAGAVADFVLDAMVCGRRLARAYVNDGGDIALHLAPGRWFDVGIVGRIDAPSIDAVARIAAESPVRGVATSGWAGRSFSLGIADAVTVLARSGASADAAATLIANAVDVASDAVRRRPANSLDDDTDLGKRLVTVAVGRLSEREIDTALAAGRAVADAMRTVGDIEAAYLALRGKSSVVGGPAPMLTRAPETRAA
jgi:hypothetical protein